MTAISHARVRTNNGSQYVIQLSRDWLRAASLLVCDHTHMAITLPFGHCELNAAPDFLDIALTADSVSAITSFENVLSDHLDRISHGERLRYEWVFSPEGGHAHAEMRSMSRPARLSQPTIEVLEPHKRQKRA